MAAIVAMSVEGENHQQLVFKKLPTSAVLLRFGLYVNSTNLAFTTATNEFLLELAVKPALEKKKRMTTVTIS